MGGAEGGLSFKLPRDITAQIESELDTVQNLSPQRMLKLTRYGSWNPTFVKNWSARIEPYRQLGLPNEVAAPDEWHEWLRIREGWRPRFRDQFAEFMKRNAGRTEAFAGLDAVLNEGGTLRFWMLNEDVLLARLVHAGRFGAVFGKPDWGKTDTLFTLSRIAIDLIEDHLRSERSPRSRLSRLVAKVDSIDSRGGGRGPSEDGGDEASERRARNRLGLVNSNGIRVIINAQVDPNCRYGRYFDTVYDMLHMVRQQHAAVVDGMNSLVVVDEFGRVFPKLHQNRKQAEEVMKWIRVIRKTSSELVISTQEDGDVPLIIADWFQTRIWKRSPYRAQIDIQSLPGWSQLRVAGFPTVGDDVVFNSMEASNFRADDFSFTSLDAAVSSYRLEHPLSDPVASSRETAKMVVDYCDDLLKKWELGKALPAAPPKSKKARAELPEDEDDNW